MYKEILSFTKVISDENRLKIIDMLSCKELSHKSLLIYLNISQPTLSHHIKILQESGLVIKRVEGNMHYYKLNKEEFNHNINLISTLSAHKETCICFEMENDAK